MSNVTNAANINSTTKKLFSLRGLLAEVNNVVPFNATLIDSSHPDNGKTFTITMNGGNVNL